MQVAAFQSLHPYDAAYPYVVPFYSTVGDAVEHEAPPHPSFYRDIVGLPSSPFMVHVGSYTRSRLPLTGGATQPIHRLVLVRCKLALYHQSIDSSSFVANWHYTTNP